MPDVSSVAGLHLTSFLALQKNIAQANDLRAARNIRKKYLCRDTAHADHYTYYQSTTSTTVTGALDRRPILLPPAASNSLHTVRTGFCH
mmetsp:Transcript_97956/g.261484  ORF Transcript_97956/g.261484 Transcript_97956/m.261484 type:complete len:89 (-) Transcript_97956:91-357(-)